MNSQDFVKFGQLELDALRQLAAANAIGWCKFDSGKPGLESYEGKAPGFHINVVRANTEKGPTYEGMSVRGGMIMRMTPELAKELWDAAYEAVANPKPVAANTVVEIDGQTILVGDTTPRLPPPLMAEPPHWLEGWAEHDIEARQSIPFFTRMIGALKMPVVEGDNRTLPLWHVSATGSIYAIDRERHTFTLIKGKPDEWHWKNYAVLRRLGYTVDIRPVEMEIGSGKTSVTIFESRRSPLPGSATP